MHRNILIAGGAGFVGSNLALRLAREWPEANLFVIDNLRRRGSEFSLARLKAAEINFHHGDVRNTADLDDLPDIDLIVECSAEPSVLSGVNESPRYMLDSNLNGALNCLELARKRNADLMFLSTSRVYPLDVIGALPYSETDTRFIWEDCKEPGILGWSKDGVAEDFPLAGTRSLYGASKLSAELLAHEYAVTYDLNIVINRCGVIAGPWQFGKVDQGVFALWVFKHMFGGELAYIGYGGTGKQVRDVLHIDDLCDLVVRQCQDLTGKRANIFNVGGGLENTLSLCELTEICEGVCGTKISINSVAANRPFDLPLYLTDNKRVFEAYGWKPKRSAGQVVEDIFSWASDHQDELRSII